LILAVIALVLSLAGIRGGGTRMWEVGIGHPLPPLPVGDLDGDGGSDVVLANSSVLEAVSGRNGNVVWKRAMDVLGLVALGNTVLVLDAEGRLHGVDVRSGSDRYGAHLGFTPRELRPLGGGFHLVWGLGNASAPAGAYLAYTGDGPDIVWSFLVQVYTYSDSPFYAQVVGDVDGDGEDDVVLLCNVIYQEDMYVRFWIVGYGGQLLEDRNISDRQFLPDWRAVAHVDVDGDDLEEVLLAARDRYGAFWLFIIEPGYVRMYPMQGLTSLAFGRGYRDVDGDGWLDIPCFGPSGLALLSGKNGHEIWDTDMGVIRYVIQLDADLDGDGLPDLLVLGQDRSATVSLSDGSPIWEYDEGRPWWPIGDLDGDGLGDIPVLDESGSEVVVVSASSAEPLWSTNLVLDPPIREVGASEIFGIPGLYARNSTHIQLSYYGYENPTLVEGALGVVGPLDLDGDGVDSEFVMYSAETVFSVSISEVVECPSI